jgi:hypothetical protein
MNYSTLSTDLDEFLHFSYSKFGLLVGPQIYTAIFENESGFGFGCGFSNGSGSCFISGSSYGNGDGYSYRPGYHHGDGDGNGGRFDNRGKV